MKTTTVAILGHSRINNYREFNRKLSKVLYRLIEEENAETFLFKGESCFVFTCLEVVTELKQKYYPLIKRVYVAASDEKTDEKLKDYLKNYDEVYNPYGARKGGCYSTVKRHLIMVDMCDILITSFNKDYQLLKGVMRSTKDAVEYALKSNKKVINLYY